MPTFLILKLQSTTFLYTGTALIASLQSGQHCLAVELDSMQLIHAKVRVGKAASLLNEGDGTPEEELGSVSESITED